MAMHRHKEKEPGLNRYQAMLVEDFKAMPDFYFNIELLAYEPPVIARGLAFDCQPVGTLFELPANGKCIQAPKRDSGMPLMPRPVMAKRLPRNTPSPGKRGSGGLAMEVT